MTLNESLSEMKSAWIALVVFLVLFGFGCSSRPPADIENICYVFDERRDWYKAALRAQKRWRMSVPVAMAIIYQESRFQAQAKPPRRYWLGFIPGPRPSTAYGYAQALETTWDVYRKQTKRHGADRDDFADAIDFVGWYNHKSVKELKLAFNDAKPLYLAYHEGQGGYKRGTYRQKKWLMLVAAKVKRRADRYRGQLAQCQKQLQAPWWKRL